MPNQTDEIIAGFVEEDAYLREEVPEPTTVPVVSPMSITLGVCDRVLEDTVFTKVKMQIDDFRAVPRQLPRLIFANKEKLLKNPALAGELSPLVLALSQQYSGPLFTLINEDINKQILAIMRNSYLLLPLYASRSRGLKPWGIDIVYRDRHPPVPGKLRMKVVGCDHLYLFGKKYQLSGAEYGLVDFWKHYSHWSLKDFVARQLLSHDIAEDLAPALEGAC